MFYYNHQLRKRSETMEQVKIIKQDGNRTIGIFKDRDGEFTAMTYGSSKTFKSLKGAEKWLAARGYA